MEIPRNYSFPYKKLSQVNYYSPFDDLFGLAALVSKGNDSDNSSSLSASPTSDKSYWREHQRERSDSEESVFGSEKDPTSPVGVGPLNGCFHQIESPIFESPPKEFEFPNQVCDHCEKPRFQKKTTKTTSTAAVVHNQRFNSVPVLPVRRRSSQPFMTMTYEDFLKTIDNLSPLISLPTNTAAPPSGHPSPSSHFGGQIQTSTTRFDAASMFLGVQNNSLTAVATDKKPTSKYCVFCKNNGEEEYFYNNHVLKSDNGIIVCPVLRAYQCPICHASGDYAHTIKYCPLGKGNEQDWMVTRHSAGHRVNSRTSSTKI